MGTPSDSPYRVCAVGGTLRPRQPAGLTVVDAPLDLRAPLAEVVVTRARDGMAAEAAGPGRLHYTRSAPNRRHHAHRGDPRTLGVRHLPVTCPG